MIFQSSNKKIGVLKDIASKLKLCIDVILKDLQEKIPYKLFAYNIFTDINNTFNFKKLSKVVQLAKKKKTFKHSFPISFKIIFNVFAKM